LSNVSRLVWGLIYAFVACAFWSTLYIDTTFIAPYGTADLAIIRFFFSAIVAIAILLTRGKGNFLKERTLEQWTFAVSLGFLGFTGYYFFLATAIKYTSEVITAAIIGMISVITLLLNNMIYREFKWAAVALPAILGCAGVGIIIQNQMQAAEFVITAGSLKPFLGITSALIALAMWSAYQVLNRVALLRFKTVSSEDWTILTLIGGATALPVLIAALPVSSLSQEFVIYSRPLDDSILPLLMWGFFLALGPSLVSVSAWNESQKYLPPTLGGQTIVFLLPLVFGIGWHYGRFSTNPGGAVGGIGLLIASVVATIVLQHPPAWLPQTLIRAIRSLRRANAEHASH
jgi:drug/metabolite transporter (DMT)-like permease